MTNKPPLKAAEIIDLLGGRIVLWRRLQAAGVGISIKAIENWRAKGSIPAKRLKQLVELAAGMGLVLNINDFLTTENDQTTDTDKGNE